MLKFEKVVESYTYSYFGQILYVLHKNNTKYLGDTCAKYGLTILQLMCLVAICKKRDITQQELTEIYHLTKGGIANAIYKLQEDNFIVRQQSDVDKRKYVLKLTEKGNAIVPTLMDIYEGWEEKLGVKDLDEEFVETLRELTYKSIALNSEE